MFVWTLQIKLSLKSFENVSRETFLNDCGLYCFKCFIINSR